MFNTAVATHQLTIAELGPQGDGIHCEPRGRIYVERTLPGDQVTARIRRDEAGLVRGEIIEINELSPHRQSAPCPAYDSCGNCTLQHVQLGYYRSWKNQLVAQAFARQGLSPRRWLPSVFIGGGNRRRATFTAVREKGKIEFGFYRRRSQQVSPIGTCLVADPQVLAIRDRLQPHLNRLLCGGEPLDVFLQIAGDGAEIVFTGPIGRHAEPDDRLLSSLDPLLCGTVRRISWRPRPLAPIRELRRRGSLRVRFGELEVDLPPAAFLQPTPQGEAVLVEKVLAALPGEGRFADLFSGCGTFTGPMLSRGAVDAYESALPAVRALQRAGHDKLKAFRRDLFVHPLRREEGNRYDAIVFDPPRGGCPEQAAAIASARIPRLIGVSCNPATFARDARLLCDGGYRLDSLQVVDQFLWSHHVEVEGVFSK
jgi:23S rRNA (uracil1939-C5)-methyltransferase